MPKDFTLIRQASDLPKEFNRSHYSGLSQLGIDEWVALIFARKTLRREIDDARSRQVINEPLRASVCHLLANPLLEETRSGDQLANAAPNEVWRFERMPDAQAQLSPGEMAKLTSEAWCVSALTTFSVMSMAYDIKRYGNAIRAYKRYKTGTARVADRRILQEPIHAVGNPPHEALHPLALKVEVSLWPPDEIIVSDFRRWLKSIRTEMRSKQNIQAERKTPQAFGSENLHAIANSGALQYMDLCLWADSHGKRIPDRLHAKAIYDDVDAWRRIRETVAVWAAWLEQEGYSAMQGQCCARPI